MSLNLNNIKDIEGVLSMLKPDQITTLLGKVVIHKKPRFNNIDNSRREYRLKVSDLYFSAEPKPHQLINDRPMTPEEYSGHRQGVWEQVMSGVDL